MTTQQRQRKIQKLKRLQAQLSAEARNPQLPRSDRMGLAKASDALRWAIQDMETGQ